MERPFSQSMLPDGRIIRTFESDVLDEELEWHQDRRHRAVRVLEGRGWKLQLESGLPFEMNQSATYEIPKASWHRILKGTGRLVVEITEI